MRFCWLPDMVLVVKEERRRRSSLTNLNQHNGLWGYEREILAVWGSHPTRSHPHNCQELPTRNSEEPIFNARWPGRAAGSSCSKIYYTKIVSVTTKVKIFIVDKNIERGSSSWQDDCGSHGTVFSCPADDHDKPRCHALKMPESLSSLRST